LACVGPAASAANHGTMTLKKLAAVHGSLSDGYLLSPSVPSHSDILDMLSHVARRDRFVFRQNQLEILEQSFVEDSYPTYERREQIADLCNTSTEASCKLDMNLSRSFCYFEQFANLLFSQANLASCHLWHQKCVAAYGLWVEGLAWLIGVVGWTTVLVVVAMDGHIMHCSIISSS